MSGFFAGLTALAFFAVIYFVVQMFRRRPKSGRRVFQAFGATVVFSLLGAFTETDADRQASAERQAATTERQQAENRQQAKDEVTRITERQDAEAQRAADQRTRDKAEAVRKANTSIEPGDMVYYCKDQIKARLKLPDTARYPGTFDSSDKGPVIGPTGAVWRAWVESENSFGGTVRNKFTCTYTKAGNGMAVDFQEQ